MYIYIYNTVLAMFTMNILVQSPVVVCYPTSKYIVEPI